MATYLRCRKIDHVYLFSEQICIPFFTLLHQFPVFLHSKTLFYGGNTVIQSLSFFSAVISSAWCKSKRETEGKKERERERRRKRLFSLPPSSHIPFLEPHHLNRPSSVLSLSLSLLSLRSLAKFNASLLPQNIAKLKN